jgi:hypothetical protein
MGEYDKLRALIAFMEQMVARFHRKAQELATAEGQGGQKVAGRRPMTGRVLTEDDGRDDDSGSHEDHGPTLHQDEDLSALSDFNRKFQTSIVQPIVYKFRDDTKIKGSVDYHAMLFEPGVVKVYDLSSYKTQFVQPGLNLWEYGQSAKIDYHAATTIWEKLYPEGGNDVFDNFR